MTSDADGESRFVVIGMSDDKGCNNSVTTAKYTIITFLPIVRTSFVYPHHFVMTDGMKIDFSDMNLYLLMHG